MSGFFTADLCRWPLWALDIGTEKHTMRRHQSWEIVRENMSRKGTQQMQRPCGRSGLEVLQEQTNKHRARVSAAPHPCREELKTVFLKMAGPPATLSYQDSVSPSCGFGDSRMSPSARMLGMLFLFWPGPACPQLWDSSFIMYFQSSATPKEAIWQNVQRTLKMFMPFDSGIPHLGI